MRRTIKFRGISIATCKWVTGFYRVYKPTNQPEVHKIYNPLDNSEYDVIEESVCEYTGHSDIRGIPIYEGDIVTHPKDKRSSFTTKPMLIRWSKKFTSFCIERERWLFVKHFGFELDPEECEVIGNIYQNPELLISK